MKKFITSFAFLAVLLAASVVHGQISLGPSGSSGILTFGKLPTVADGWASVTNAGGSGDVTDAATLDGLVITNEVSNINIPLTGSGTVPISAGNIARWHSTRFHLMTPPTGVRNTILLATIRNDTGVAQPSVIISYDLGENNADGTTVTEEVPGQRVFYSTTGAAGSWVLIPEFSSVPIGPLLVTLNLGSWANGALLYVMWADDNAGADRNNGGTEEGGYTIDNFLVATSVACPTIDQHPSNTNNIAGRTVSLSVTASGPGLMYQWTGPNDLSGNPTATTPTLVINNAQVTDTGDYFVTVANSCGSVNSGSAHVEIVADVEPPRLLSASFGPGLNTFILTTDEELSTNGCGINSLSVFVWSIVQADNPGISLQLGEDVTMLTPTTYRFVTTDPRIPGTAYRIVAGQFDEISDLSCNFISLTNNNNFAETVPQVSFQQGDPNGYVGTQDTELHSEALADTIQGANLAVSIDNDDAGFAQGLLRFDNIVGTAAGQIPPGAVILSATLSLNQTDPGSSANFHRMLVPWDQAVATWNSMVGGLTADGVEAATASDALSANEDANANNPHDLNVTASVQAWADGQANYGWAIISTGTGGWDFNTSESGATTAPLLTVEYRTVPCTEMPSIVTQPPAAIAANEAQSFSITVGADACLPTYQWTKDNVDISGANNATYTVASASPADAGSYRLRVTNPNGTVTSSAAVVTVTPDLTAPTVVSVSGGTTPTTVTITFSKPVTAATAENVANYTITPSLAISGAVLGANGTTVTLTTAARTAGTRYVLTIRNIRDTRASQNLLSPNPTSVPLAYQVQLLSFTDAWKYDQSTTDLGTAWRAPGYDDSAWPSGAGVLGFETTAASLTFLRGIAPPDGTNTILSLTNSAGQTNPTIYFRTTFNNPLSGIVTYTMRAYIDDGAVWFLNGSTESGRYNISNTPTLFNTMADAASPEAALVTATLTGVTTGVNSLAVEVHQNALNSSDIAWGAEILANFGGSVLQIVHNPNGSVTVSWAGLGTLQESAAVNGPWSNSASQTNPQTRPSSGSARFFRLQFTPP